MLRSTHYTKYQLERKIHHFFRISDLVAFKSWGYLTLYDIASIYPQVIYHVFLIQIRKPLEALEFYCNPCY